MRALILAPYDTGQLERLQERLDVVYESWLETRRIYDPLELGGRLKREGFTILVVESDFVFEELMDKADSLRLIGICRAATNHIDIEAATARGVVVVNTPGRNAQAVAEHALALMLALARRVPTAHSYVKQREWQDPVEPYLTMRGIELMGRTLGIIGLGAIGRTLARIASALGMEVLGYDPYVQQVDGVSLVDLDTLMARSDFVSIHVPLTSQTEGLVDASRLALMRKTAYLVNASDASVVRQEAVVDALKERRIAGAAFDVFQTHPVAPDSPLLTLDNVILTPHIGGATAETIRRHSCMMTDDILRFLDGQRPVNLVNQEVWERRG